MQVNFQVREIANGIVVGYSHPYEVYGPEGANERERYFKDFTEFLIGASEFILEAWSFHKQQEAQQNLASQEATLGEPIYQPESQYPRTTEDVLDLNEAMQAKAVQSWKDKMNKPKHVDADDPELRV